MGPGIIERIDLSIRHWVMWTVLRRKAYLFRSYYRDADDNIHFVPW